MYIYLILLGTARGMGIFGLKFEELFSSSSSSSSRSSSSTSTSSSSSSSSSTRRSSSSSIVISVISVIIIIIISLFKVDFTITFHNYKKPINFHLPMRRDTNSMTK